MTSKDLDSLDDALIYRALLESLRFTRIFHPDVKTLADLRYFWREESKSETELGGSDPIYLTSLEALTFALDLTPSIKTLDDLQRFWQGALDYALSNVQGEPKT